MKNREFKTNGKRYVIVESNNTIRGKWQAMVFSTHYNAWTRTGHYANTQAELKEKVKDYERELI